MVMQRPSFEQVMAGMAGPGAFDSFIRRRNGPKIPAPVPMRQLAHSRGFFPRPIPMIGARPVAMGSQPYGAGGSIPSDSVLAPSSYVQRLREKYAGLGRY